MDTTLHMGVLNYTKRSYSLGKDAIQRLFMHAIPHEIAWGEIYFTPLLLVAALAYGLTLLTTKMSVKTGLYRYISHPTLAEICLFVIFTGVISQVISIV